MRDCDVTLPKRVVVFIIVILVVMLLLPVCEAAFPYEIGPFFQKGYSDFHSMTEGQKTDLANWLLQLPARVFNKSLEESKANWNQAQVQEFMDWLISVGIFTSPVDSQTGMLSTTFMQHGCNTWPVNVPKPAQGCLMQISQGGNTQSYVIQGTTRTTYNELKARVEAGEWKLADENGKEQVENDVKENFGPRAKTPEEFYDGLGVAMQDEAYYSRTDDQGSLGMAFGGNTTMLIVTQETPGNPVEEPFPTIYSSDMSLQQKRALLFSLLNMGTDELDDVLKQNLAALSTDVYQEFIDFINEQLLAMGEDVYNEFWGRLL